MNPLQAISHEPTLLLAASRGNLYRIKFNGYWQFRCGATVARRKTCLSLLSRGLLEPRITNLPGPQQILITIKGRESLQEHRAQ